MRLILLGPPGAGKGTQAEYIINEYKIPHISTGDIFRKNIKEETELGLKVKAIIANGDLVPDSLTVEIVADRLKEADCIDGFLLDGFPRNTVQAEALESVMEKMDVELNAAINIEVDPSVLTERAVGRRLCKNCGATYHIKFNAPNVDGVCDKCGNELYQRSDDVEETVKNRIDVYVSETSPLIDYYSKKDRIINVDGQQDIAKVFADIKADLRRS